MASSTYSWLQNTQTTLWNGKITTRTYDDYSRPKVVNNGIQTYTYTYDNANNITSDGNKNYTYDQIYRLTQVSSTNSGTTLETYTYDKAGNRTSDGLNSYTTNSLNQYTQVTSSGATTNYIYDDNGNLVNDGEKQYAYDYKNRLVKVIKNTTIVVEYAYDVLGRRYEKKTPTKTIQYLYSNENILEEIQTVGNTTTKKNYINGLWTDDVIAVDQQEVNLTTQEKAELNFCNERVTPYATEFAQYGYTNITERCNSLWGSGAILVTNRYYFHKDNLGSIVGISDGSWNTVSEYSYDSYGNFSLSGADIWNERLFTGREYDEEVGLYYNRARYYNPKLGRFISQDPIGQLDDVNLYAYVGNNPVNATDPSGLNSKKVVVNITWDFYTQIHNVLDQPWYEKVNIFDFFNDTRWKYNFKKLKPFRDNDYNKQAFSVEWVEIRWDELGNFFVWFNWIEENMDLIILRYLEDLFHINIFKILLEVKILYELYYHRLRMKLKIIHII